MPEQSGASFGRLLLISENEAKSLVTLSAAIDAVEAVFALHDSGDGEVFPVASGHGSGRSNSFAIKSGLIPAKNLVGCKIGTYWPDNRKNGTPAHASTILVLDDATGYPRALVAASYLTSVRTAAADAVAVKHLARPDVQVLGIIGAGHQAFYDACAVFLVRNFTEVRVWSRTMSSSETLVKSLVKEGLPARCSSLESASAADVLLTVTSSKVPLVERSFIRPGAHISAMGADTRGKQELDVAIPHDAVCVADTVEQSISIGELQTAFEQGMVRKSGIQTLGSIVRGASPGRQTPGQITLFDSSGIALQDLAVAELAIAQSKQKNPLQIEW